MRGQSILATLILAATGAHAHATFQELWVAGSDQAGKCVRLPPSNNPITSVSGSDITCNVGGSTAVSGVCSVKAGDTLAAEMHQHTQRTGEEAIGGDHYGPTIIYMAKVSDFNQSPQSAGWFKVAEMGLVSANPQKWATQTMNDNGGKVSFTVPSDIAPGNYLVRAEVIALHVAQSAGGAQFYVGCYQINVTGGGSASPATVKFPGAYSASDPGILINIHYPVPTSYTIPGPAVYKGGAGSSPSNPSTTVANPAPTTTATKPVSTATSTIAAPTSTAVAGMYQQCGGSDYKGPTACVTGAKCVAVSPPYYYQCQ